jgi:hypothetical protein
MTYLALLMPALVLAAVPVFDWLDRWCAPLDPDARAAPDVESGAG